jgi:diadenosine tetraphosphate (Ap4A) HIT family hydrolase
VELTCVACAEVAERLAPLGGTIYEDAAWHVSHHRSPYASPGELVVKSKRHCEAVGDLTTSEAAALGVVLQSASHALASVVPAERIYVASYGETQRHVHFFILPRTRVMPPGSAAVHVWIQVRRLLCRLRLLTPATDADRARVASRVREAWPGASQR